MLKRGDRIGAMLLLKELGTCDQAGTVDSFRVDSLAQWEPGFPGFRNSAGFKKLLERLGVPKYWAEHGYPPQCRTVGAKDYTCD